MECSNILFNRRNTSIFRLAVKYWSNSAPQVSFFTRDGDTGVSHTIDGEQKEKDDQIFHAVGSAEELSSYIGLAREYAKEKEHGYTDKLKRIQCILVDIASCILRSGGSSNKISLSSRHTQELEDWINEYSSQLPPLENHIIPGGGKASSSLHVARSICRRAERCLVPLVRSGDVDKETQAYLNRLSDFLLTVSRVAARIDKKDESIYIPQQEKLTEKT